MTFEIQDDIDRLRETIASVVPDSAASGVRVLGAGQFSLALVAGDLVFRFPRHESGAAKLRMEARLLEWMAGRLPVAIPEPVHADLDAPVGTVYLAHRFVAGRVVTRDDASALATRAGPDTGRFLAALHAFDPQDVPDVVPRMDIRRFAARLRERTESLLFPRIDDAARRRAARELADIEALEPRPLALCHCDVGGHILFDESTGRVGAIDFGDAMVSDPVLDAASLSVLGETFVNEAAREYPLLADLADDARLVRASFVLQDALAGAEQDEWEYADAVMAGYGDGPDTAASRP